MKIKNILILISAIIIPTLLVKANDLPILFDNSIIHDSTSNGTKHIMKFEIIPSNKIGEIKELIITPVIADSDKNEIFILTNGFSKINDLAKGKITNEYSLCSPDYYLDYLHINRRDTIKIGSIDCSDHDYDVYIDSDFRFKISKDVMNYIERTSIKIKLLNKEFKNNEEARKWYSANKDRIRLYNHYRAGFDDLVGFIDVKDTAKIINIGCTLNRKRKGNNNERRFVCDDIYEKQLIDHSIKYERINYSQEIWYRENKSMPNKR